VAISDQRCGKPRAAAAHGFDGRNPPAASSTTASLAALDQTRRSASAGVVPQNAQAVQRLPSSNECEATDVHTEVGVEASEIGEAWREHQTHADGNAPPSSPTVGGRRLRRPAGQRLMIAKAMIPPPPRPLLHEATRAMEKAPENGDRQQPAP